MGKEKKDFCPYCRKLVSYTMDRRKESYVYSGKVIFFPRDYAVCDECKRDLDIPGLLDHNNALLDEAIKNNK